jgi:uncharacterized protein (DUF1778 family)
MRTVATIEGKVAMHMSPVINVPTSGYLEKMIRLMYSLKAYIEEGIMPRVAIENTKRFAMRIPPAVKARLMHAASLEQASLKDFMVHHALRAADLVITQAERIVLSERDTRLWLDLLDTPP